MGVEDDVELVKACARLASREASRRLISIRSNSREMISVMTVGFIELTMRGPTSMTTPER